MKKQNIGLFLFWIGVFGLLYNYFYQWISNPKLKDNTPLELSETIWATEGFLFNFNGYLTLAGIGFTIIGILLYSSGKGSRFWLWGFVPFIAFALLSIWQPSFSYPPLFGIGGGITTLSYIIVLWFWKKNHTAYEGIAKTGFQIQLIGYSFLYITALFLCIYIGTPKQPALANIQIVSGESIIIAFSVCFVLLTIGQYYILKQKISEE